MKDIFTDLYRKVLGFFQTEEKEPEESKTVAVNRMKLVLMQDRTNLTPFLLERMRGEMIEVLAKYVEMDKEALELSFEQEGDQMALMLSIPVLRAKDEEEIQAMIKADETDCEQRAKRLADEQDVADPFNASNQAEAKAAKEAEEAETEEETESETEEADSETEEEEISEEKEEKAEVEEEDSEPETIQEKIEELASEFEEEINTKKKN